VLLPGTLRALVFRAAGARLESPPGIGFVFAGRPQNLVVGSNVYMNQRVFIEAVGPVTIGTDCAFGMEAMIITSHHTIDERGRWDARATGRAVTIGDRVWVGARAVILPGARVESDTVIAAGAVVTGHCPAHGVYAGVPARRIRDFSPAADTEPPAQPIR
jgi:maltose O-acetyltransferase